MRRPRNRERQLQEVLGDGVATQAQLQRWGLWSTAVEHQLPMLTLDMTLHGRGSTRPVTCVALDPAVVDPRRTSPRILGHEITATELIERRPLPRGLVWHRSKRSSTGRHTVPDWWIWDEVNLRIIALVELDLGYSNGRLGSKLIGAVQGASSRRHPTLGYILGTTLKGRVQPFTAMAAEVAEELPQLIWAESWWLDVESPVEPYVNKPRTKKADFSRWESPRAAPPPAEEDQPG